MSFAIFILLFFILAIKYAFVVVPEGYEYTLERLGKFMRVLHPGFHIVMPFFDVIGAKLNMKEQTLSIPQQKVLTKDEVVLLVDGVLSFQIIDSQKAAYQVRDLQAAILKLASTNIRSAIEGNGGRTKEEALSKRSSIAYKITDIMDEATVPWGVKIIRFDIQEISQPPTDYFEKPKNYYGK